MVKVAAQLARAQHFGTRSVGVRLGEITDTGLRLESSAYALEARQAVIELQACGYPLKVLLGNEGICQDAHNAFRFKRIYVGPEQGVPFLSSSDIIGLRPERGCYVSRKHTKKLEELQIKPWDVLVSRSGTIGNISLASPRIADWVLSEDVIRLTGPDPDTAGYVAAFLRSRWGRAQLVGMTYGSVVQHIEPHHLRKVWIPELPAIRRIEIGRAFVNAAKSRDKANDLLDAADTRLCATLKLPPIPETKQGPQITTICSAAWCTRLDASFHNPTVYRVEDQLQQLGLPVLPLGDSKLTQAIRAVTKFRKRIYVPRGGIPLLSSKQLFQIDPIGIKRLAKGAHTDDLEEICLKENMVAITRSGTIGRVQLVPKYMDGWANSEHTIRAIATTQEMAGYLYAWLASSYGQELIARYSYGSVIVEIDRFMVAKIPVPVPVPEELQEIAKPVLDANFLRHEAWNLEQEALKVLDGEIAAKP